MGTASDQLVPTPRLRWLDARADKKTRIVSLQQWWAPNAPQYMIDPSIGEWRNVPVTVEESK